MNGFTLHVPPLRQRPADIGPLAARFLKMSAEVMGGGRSLQLTAPALARLEQHPWPGNVRELRNVIDRAALLCRDGRVASEHLIFDEIEAGGGIDPRSAREPTPAPAVAPRATPPSLAARGLAEAEAEVGKSGGDGGDGMRAEMAAIEQRRITEALEKFGGNQTRAAAFLKISRRTLLKRLDAYGSTRPRKPRPQA